MNEAENAANAPRDKWRAMWRGFRGRCPNCGEGRMFNAYLKVADACDRCGQELHHHRADDAPPYFTILIVGHVVGALLLAVDEIDPDLPMWIHMIVWPALVIILSAALLPRIKGALVALQWALRMHGFDGETERATT